MTEPKIGDMMPDGTKYAGISPDTGMPMYAMPEDAPGVYTFGDITVNEPTGITAKERPAVKKSAEYSKSLNDQKACGHIDWRVPTRGELNVLFNNRAAFGGFNVGGSYPGGYYWSSSNAPPLGAWMQSFYNGQEIKDTPMGVASLRCVR